ncbi:HAD family hydrolase [Sphingobium estronivorans]|uniref:HAD family hydrolase n=1 Tax=Sphingobium estronivorans TaxID=1577690 RepID=UPI00123AD311|nr:HAD family hydrolase [Sphingobium estronivorans]
MIDWDRLDLIVFDLDGTLYDQPPVRRRMAVMLAGEVIRSRSTAVPRMLGAYRRRREALAEAMAQDFAREQYCLPGCDPGAVRAVVSEWMEQRPLPLLRRFRVEGAGRLFARLSASHKVAVHSDYRVEAKLAALGLSTRYAVAAEDVGRLKPDPAGLRWLMAMAGADPSRTLMIGDRDDRDGEAARRAGVRALIRGRDFRHYNDPVFGHAA